MAKCYIALSDATNNVHIAVVKCPAEKLVPVSLIRDAIGDHFSLNTVTISVADIAEVFKGSPVTTLVYGYNQDNELENYEVIVENSTVYEDV